MFFKICVNFLKSLILLYQKTLSPFFGVECRFYPTCSNYALWILDFKNLHLQKIIFRIFRCNPFFEGGVDYPVLFLKIRVDFSQSCILDSKNKSKGLKKIKYWLAPLEKIKDLNFINKAFLINAKFKIIKSF